VGGWNLSEEKNAIKEPEMKGYYITGCEKIRAFF
jgi:hypothetical protein